MMSRKNAAILAAVGLLLVVGIGWKIAHPRAEGGRQKAGAEKGQPAEEPTLCYFTVERPLSPGEVTSEAVLRKHEFKRSQNDFEVKRYDEYKNTQGALLVEQDSDAYNQVVATDVASGDPLVKTFLLGPAREISLAVRVKHVWLWQEGPGGVRWGRGEEVVGDYLRQALLCQLPSSSESASIVAAMGTVRTQVHLDEKKADFIIEVEGNYGFNPEAATCELRGRFFRQADSLMVGQAVVEFPAPPPPKRGGKIAEGLILRGLLRKASLRLAEELGGRFDSIPPPPPAAEEAEEEKKPAEGTAAPQVPQPAKGGVPWGWVVAGLTVLVIVGLGRWAWRKGYRVQPPPNQQGGGP